MIRQIAPAPIGLPVTALVVPGVVAGFFAAALVAVTLRNRPRVRRSYVTGFLSVLIAVNLMLSVVPAPMFHWHKFSEQRPAEQTHYEIRVVDADGRELYYDSAATLGSESVRMNDLERKMRTEFSDRKNREVALWLLERARKHRDRIEDPSVLRFLRFPPHGVSDRWTTGTVDDYSSFVGIRLYRVDVATSEDGTEIAAVSEELVAEYYPTATDLLPAAGPRPVEGLV